MTEFLNVILFFITNRWGVIFAFLCLIIAGIIVDRCQKQKGTAQPEKEELDKAVASFSGMNQIPWQEQSQGKDRKEKSRIESYYTGKNKRLSNMRTIIYKEYKIMRERSKDIAERDNKKVDEEN